VSAVGRQTCCREGAAGPAMGCTRWWSAWS